MDRGALSALTPRQCASSASHYRTSRSMIERMSFRDQVTFLAERMSRHKSFRVRCQAGSGEELVVAGT